MIELTTEVTNSYAIKAPSDDDWVDLFLQGTRSSAQVFAEQCDCPIGIKPKPFTEQSADGHYSFFARRRDFSVVVTLINCVWRKQDPRPTLAWPPDHAEELLP